MSRAVHTATQTPRGMRATTPGRKDTATSPGTTPASDTTRTSTSGTRTSPRRISPTSSWTGETSSGGSPAAAIPVSPAAATGGETAGARATPGENGDSRHDREERSPPHRGQPGIRSPAATPEREAALAAFIRALSGLRGHRAAVSPPVSRGREDPSVRREDRRAARFGAAAGRGTPRQGDAGAGSRSGKKGAGPGWQPGSPDRQRARATIGSIQRRWIPLKLTA